jgi:hypothetical protein
MVGAAVCGRCHNIYGVIFVVGPDVARIFIADGISGGLTADGFSALSLIRQTCHPAFAGPLTKAGQTIPVTKNIPAQVML